MDTLYEYATKEMKESIEYFFITIDETDHLSSITEKTLESKPVRDMLLAGKSLSPENIDAQAAARELSRVESVPFDVERGASYSVYHSSRFYIDDLIEKAYQLSNQCTSLDPQDIADNPYLLPIWQAMLNIPSKAAMKNLFGSVSDRHLSRNAAEKISEYANSYFQNHSINRAQIKERTERTLEGIVRDLVGRLLFESIVKNALESKGIPFTPEEECSGLSGVIYSHRPDFVIPNEDDPIAFIEVRKSSSRHASLYAKDKMFSAINWKGKHPKMLAILFTEGEWTRESLITMAKVFDYVVPVSRAMELAEKIKDYMNGDDSILKWIIQFDIQQNNESLSTE